MTSPHRARMVGTRHMAAAGHYLATQAAFQILEAGGTQLMQAWPAGSLSPWCKASMSASQASHP